MHQPRYDVELDGANIVVLDLETANDPDTVPDGWRNKLGLGLSIGAYWDYRADRMLYFDPESLLETVQEFVERQCLLVSYNGTSFDFALMRALLRHGADTKGDTHVQQLCDQFKAQALDGYDILREIWLADPENRYAPGLNGLDAVAKCNGIGGKTSDGKSAAQDWQAGRYARVINYCSHDVYLTKTLFEILVMTGGQLVRANGILDLRDPQTKISLAMLDEGGV